MGNKFLLRRGLRRSCSMIALAGFGMALAGGATARAQTANAPVNLDLGSVLATGSAAGAGSTDYQNTPGTAPYLAPSVTPLNSTQPTSLVNKNTIQNNFIGSQSYADIATLTPSVSTIDANGPGLQETTGPVIRGFQDGQYNVTYDGIPIGDSNDFTHHTTSFFMDNDIGKVIVDRGPGTAETVGDATFGGTISIRTIDPSPTTTLTPYGEYGSFGTGLEGLQVDTGAVQSADGASAVFDAEHLKSNGALTHNGQERTNFFGKVVVPISDNTTLTFLSMYNQVYQNPSIGATLDQIQNLGSDFSYDSISDPNNPASTSFYKYNFDRITSDMEYVDLTSNLGNGWLYDGKIYTYAYYHLSRYTDDQGDFLAAGGYIPGAETNVDACQASPTDPAATTCVPGQNFKNTYRSWGTIQRAEKDFDWGDIKTGVWFDHQTDTRFVQEIDQSISSNPVNYSPNDNNGGNVTASNDFGSIQRLQHNQLYTTQPYLQFDYNPISALTLTGGFKYADFRRQLNAPVNQKTETTQGFDHEWGKALPSFEVKYSFSPNLSAYAQVAEGFLAPNLNTFYISNLGSTSFAPETTWNYQTGFGYQDERLALGGDVYLVHFTSLIQSTGKGINKIFINSGGAVYKGIEGEATYALGYGFNIFANGGLNNANLTGSNDYISEVPQFTTNAGLIYSGNGIYASIIDQWTGGEYDGNGGAANPKAPGAWYDPYNVVNFAASYTFNDMLPHVSHPKISLNLLNITNQKQIIFSPGTTAGSGTPLYYTLPGVSAFVSVSVPLTF